MLRIDENCAGSALEIWKLSHSLCETTKQIVYYSTKFCPHACFTRGIRIFLKFLLNPFKTSTKLAQVTKLCTTRAMGEHVLALQRVVDIGNVFVVTDCGYSSWILMATASPRIDSVLRGRKRTAASKPLEVFGG